MAKKHLIKKTVIIAAIITVSIAVSIVVFLFFTWVQFISLPSIMAKNMSAEIVSDKLLWPKSKVLFRGQDFKVNIPFINGRALIFNQGEGRSNKLRIIEADGQIYDIQLPDGYRGLYKTFRKTDSNPVVAIWDNEIDIIDTTKFSKDIPSLKIQIEKILQDRTKIHFVEIFKDHTIATKTFKSNDRYYYIHSIGNDWATGDEKDINGISKLPVVVSLKDFKTLYLPFRDKRSVGSLFILGDKVICSFWPEPKNSYIYSLLDMSIKKVDMLFFDESFYGNVLVWKARRDKSKPLTKIDNIFYYDFSQNKTGVFVNDESEKMTPFLYKDYLFWSDKRSGEKNGFDIYVKNLRTNIIKVLVDGPDDQIYPVYFGGYLYWTNRISSMLTDIYAMTGQNYVFRKKVELP